MLCKTCLGNKKVIGLGMMLKKCRDCDGTGENTDPYHNAIEQIKKKCGVTEDEAKKLYRDESDRIDAAESQEQQGIKRDGRRRINKKS